MLDDQAETIRVVERARREGFTASYALAHDPVFNDVRAARNRPYEPASTGVSDSVRRSPFRINDTSTGVLIRSSFRIRCRSSMPATAAPPIA